MKKSLTTDKVLVIAAIGLLVSAAALILASIFQSKELQQTNEFIYTTQKVLLSSEKLLTQTINSETSSRGYLLTGQASFLDPYKESGVEIKQHMEFLRTHLKDNELQSRRFDSLVVYLQKRLHFSKRLIDLYNQQEAAAGIQLVQSGEGKLYTDQVRKIVNEIQQSENNLLAVRRAALEDKTAFFIRFLLIIVSSLLLVLFLFLLKVRYDFVNDKKNSQTLQRLNNSLEERVYERTAALALAQGEMAQMLSRITDGFSSLDTNWVYKYINDKAGELIGRKPKDLIGKTIWKEFPESVGQSFHKACMLAMQTQKYAYQQEYFPPLDEWFENHIYPSPDGVSIFFRNISEQKKAQVLLTASEEKYKLLFESNPMPMWVLDLTSLDFLAVNEAALKHYGYTKEEFLQLGAKGIRPENEVQRFVELNRTHYNALHNSGVWKHKKRDGSLIDVEIFAYNIQYEGKKASLILVNDVTERLHSEKLLKQSFEDTRRLAVHLQNIREEERKRIGREIHDELGQQLTAIKMDVVWIDKKISETEEALKEKLRNIVTLLDGSNQSVRKILKELRVDLLDSYGISQALEWQARQFTVSTGTPVSFSSNTIEIKLPTSVSNCLYRVFQEALTNITKYANARIVTCRLEYRPETISLAITDDGNGFDSTVAKSKQSFGILGMQERVSALHGSFELNTAPGKGTSLLIKLPLTGH
jgi:PAS domain S-box-containing protein